MYHIRNIASQMAAGEHSRVIIQYNGTTAMLLLHKSFKNRKLELSNWHFGHINVFIFALWSEIDPKEVTLTDEVTVMKYGLFATSTDDIAN